MAAPPSIHSEDSGLSLALAMVVSSTAPLLLLDEALNIVAASASFARTFNIEPAAIPGSQLYELGRGEWDVPQLRALISATASGDAEVDAYEMDLKVLGEGPRRLVLHVQKLSYGSPDRVRLLVAIADVTEARLSEKKTQELLRQNEMLIAEVRHRVANSLQIIASVLMQNARRSKSEETRSQLRDAHQRVLSVAELQQQLAVSTQGTVRLRAYLVKLCDSIAASMIADPKALILEVVAQDATIDAGASVSMGLIVTELVINALKHGFPDGAGGKITVDYQARDDRWALSVTDTGVGMPQGAIEATAGLGSSIIEALARQLRARVTVDDMGPGTKVSVIYPALGSDKLVNINVPETAL